MIKKEVNVTFDRCPNEVFERVYSDTYYIREKSTGRVFSEVVNYSVDIDDYEEIIDMPLPIVVEE